VSLNRYGNLEVPTNRIIAILNRRRVITGDNALRRSHLLWHECGALAEFCKACMKFD